MGRKGYFIFTAYTVNHPGQGLQQIRNLKGGADAEAIDMQRLLVLFLMACSAYLLIAPRATSLGMALLTVSWALLYQMSIKKMYRKVKSHRETQ